MSIQDLKFETYDRYVMRGGTQTLQEIEEFSLATLELVDCKLPTDLLDEVITMVIHKLTTDNLELGGIN